MFFANLHDLSQLSKEMRSFPHALHEGSNELHKAGAVLNVVSNAAMDYFSHTAYFYCKDNNYNRNNCLCNKLIASCTGETNLLRGAPITDNGFSSMAQKFTQLRHGTSDEEEGNEHAY